MTIINRTTKNTKKKKNESYLKWVSKHSQAGLASFPACQAGV